VKRYLSAILISIFLLCDSAYSQPITTTYTDFAVAISTIGSAEKTLIIASPYNLTKSVTVPANVNLYFLEGGIISLGNYSITINGTVTAIGYKIFNYSGSGVVAFGATSKQREIYYQWWGDDASANNAIAALTYYILFLSDRTVFGGTVVGGGGGGTTDHAVLTHLDYDSAGHTNFERTLGNPSVNDYVLSSTIAGVRSWIVQSGGSGGSGAGMYIYTQVVADSAWVIPHNLGIKEVMIYVVDENDVEIIPASKTWDGPNQCTITFSSDKAGKAVVGGGISAGAITDHASLSHLTYAASGHAGFEPTVTRGNLAVLPTSIATLSGETGSVIGAGTTITIKQAATGQSGYLTSNDWNTFYEKQDYHINLKAISLGTWLGATSITTLGTIAYGVWHGTIIEPLYLRSNTKDFAGIVAAGASYVSKVWKTDALGNPDWRAEGDNQTPWTSDINAAGYTLYGNSTSGGNLTLGSTSHSTKGKIYLGSEATINAASGVNRLITFSESNTPVAYVGVGTDNVLRVMEIGNRSLALTTNSIDRLTINGSGVVSITGGDLLVDRNVFIEGYLTLVNNTQSSTNGIIYKGTDWFIHNFNYGYNGAVTTDGYNVFIGKNSGNFTMGSTATQSYQSSTNIGLGDDTLRFNTKGYSNIAIGVSSLAINTIGSRNVGLGLETLQHNTTGDHNLALGTQALNVNTTGYSNVGVGTYALFNLTTGYGNTAIGENTGLGITTGSYNTILGGNVTGLSSSLSNTVIIADGEGHQRLYIDLSGNVNIPSLSASSVVRTDASKYLVSIPPTGINTYLKWSGSAYSWDTPASGGGSNWTRNDGTIYPTVTTDDLVVKAPWADIRAYGGTTSDLKTGIDAAIAAGKLYLLIPAGTFAVGTQVAISTAGVHLKGMGRLSTIIQRTSGLTIPPISISGSNCVVEDLKFDGSQNTANANADLEIASGADATLIRNVEFNNFYDTGMSIGGTNTTVETCRFIAATSGTRGTYGIWSDPGTGTPANGITITKSTFKNVNTNAYFGTGLNLKIIDNHFVNNHRQSSPTGGGQIAVKDDTANYNIIISNNTIGTGGGSAASGIEVDSRNMTITGNTIYGQQAQGIALQTANSTKNIVIVGNSIKGCGGDGINVPADIGDFIISGNRIVGNTGYGIVTTTGADYYVITSNNIRGNTAGSKLDGGGSHKEVVHNIE